MTSRISELITLLHNQETAKTNFTNNCLILATSTESTINYHKKTISLLYSVNQSLPTTHFSTTTKKKSLRLIYINRKKTIQKTLERNHVKKIKSITCYVIGQRNSSKKLESRDQSGILLCRNNDCDVIKAYLQQIQLRGKKVFFSISSRANKIIQHYRHM